MKVRGLAVDGFAELTNSQTGSGTHIDDGGSQVVFAGVDFSQLIAADFLFT